MRYAIAVILLLLVGAALRTTFVIFVHPLAGSLYSDMANYVQVASDIVTGGWRAENFFQPIGFPLLVAGLMRATPEWISVLGWMNVLASTMTVGLVWYTATQSFGRRVGLISVGIATLHLPWIVFAGFAMPETVFTLCLALLSLLTWRFAKTLRARDGLIWGLCFFVALLLKGTHVLFFALLSVLLLVRDGTAARRGLAAMLVVVFVGLLAHGALTLATTGGFQMTPSASGLNFVEGKCPSKDNEDSTGARWLSPLYAQLGRTEHKLWDHPFRDSSYFLSAGLSCIIADPWVLVQSLEGIPFLFIGNWLWPSSSTPFESYLRLYEMGYSAWAIVGLVGAALLGGGTMGSTRVLATWITPIIALFLCVYIFKSEIRFRVPFDVWIIPLGVVGWRELWRARTRRADYAESNIEDGTGPAD